MIRVFALPNCEIWSFEFGWTFQEVLPLFVRYCSISHYTISLVDIGHIWSSFIVDSGVVLHSPYGYGTWRCPPFFFQKPTSLGFEPSWFSEVSCHEVWDMLPSNPLACISKSFPRKAKKIRWMVHQPYFPKGDGCFSKPDSRGMEQHI